MLITSSKEKIHLNIHNIDCKSYIKYLGKYLDEHLQWEPQIQHVNNKLAKNVGIINKLRYYLDFHMLKGPFKYLAAKLRLLPRCKFTSGQPKMFRALFSAPARRRFKPLFNFFTSLQQTQKTLFDYIFIG